MVHPLPRAMSGDPRARGSHARARGLLRGDATERDRRCALHSRRADAVSRRRHLRPWPLPGFRHVRARRRGQAYGVPGLAESRAPARAAGWHIRGVVRSGVPHPGAAAFGGVTRRRGRGGFRERERDAKKDAGNQARLVILRSALARTDRRQPIAGQVSPTPTRPSGWAPSRRREGRYSPGWAPRLPGRQACSP